MLCGVHVRHHGRFPSLSRKAFEGTEAQRGQAAFLNICDPVQGRGQGPGWSSPVCSTTFLPMGRIPCSLGPEGSWGHDRVPSGKQGPEYTGL